MCIGFIWGLSLIVFQSFYEILSFSSSADEKGLLFIIITHFSVVYIQVFKLLFCRANDRKRIRV